MNKVNYQKQLDQTIEQLQREQSVPRLLMHSCCAPCSSYCLSYLAQYFQITVFYYNPNIAPEAEYQKRVQEQRRLLGQLPVKYPVEFAEGKYDPETFFDMARGMEKLPEGGERCFACYRLRLSEAASYAKAHGYDFFTTTLSISPLKNAEKLNQIGAELADTFGVRYLFSDFKKKEGYKKSTEISKEYHMYRQYYCGCVYSKRDRDREIALRRQQEEQML